MKYFLLIILASITFACSNTFEEIQEKHPHKVSPDKNAIIYQSSYQEKDDNYNVAIMAWFKQSFSQGGTGIFDLKTNKLDTLDIKWLSNSTIQIWVPKEAQMLRQEGHIHFLGRNLQIKYRYEKDEILNNWDTIILNKNSVIIHQLDSLEIEKAKVENEDHFYTSVDDLMWYTNMLTEKLNELNIPVIYTNFDYIKVVHNSKCFDIIDTTSTSFYTFYELKNNSIQPKELFELMDKYKVQL